MGRLELVSVVSILVAACSFSRPADVNDDGGINRSDAAIDGALDASLRGTVHVTVMNPDPNNSGLPFPGASVVFLDPDGQVVATVPTDAKGKAQADVLPGGSVTSVVQTDSTDYYMDSVLGVKPGDDLLIDPVPDQTAAGMMSVHFPTDGSNGFYCVAGSCGTSCGLQTTPLTLKFARYCTTGTMTVSGISNDSLTTANFKAYLDTPNQQFADGGTVFLVGSWPSLISRTANLSNIPADASIVDVRQFSPDRAGFSTDFSNSTPSSGSLSTTASVPPSASAVIETRVDRAGIDQYVRERVAGNGTTYALDVGSALLQQVASATLSVSTRSVSVARGAPGLPGDAFEARVSYARKIGSTTVTYHWDVIEAGPDDFVLPTMPGTVGDVNPKSTDTVAAIQGHSAVLVDADNVAGYDVARDLAFDLINAWAWGEDGNQVRVPWPSVSTFRASMSPLQL